MCWYGIRVFVLQALRRVQQLLCDQVQCPCLVRFDPRFMPPMPGRPGLQLKYPCMHVLATEGEWTRNPAGGVHLTRYASTSSSGLDGSDPGGQRTPRPAIVREACCPT
jgi:hypothetical protein